MPPHGITNSIECGDFDVEILALYTETETPARLGIFPLPLNCDLISVCATEKENLLRDSTIHSFIKLFILRRMGSYRSGQFGC
jgi:hypothetical protein